MSDEYGPWIYHDGACPQGVTNGMSLLVGYGVSGGIHPADGATIGAGHPCWFWRYRRVRTGWFRSELRRVCDNPAYAPIIRYRIRRPQALRDLIRIAENPREHEPDRNGLGHRLPAEARERSA